ncbi:MAG: hypothetical protein AB7P49_00085 [Bdellovibrionales bacterium]
MGKVNVVLSSELRFLGLIGATGKWILFDKDDETTWNLPEKITEYVLWGVRQESPSWLHLADGALLIVISSLDEFKYLPGRYHEKTKLMHEYIPAEIERVRASRNLAEKGPLKDAPMYPKMKYCLEGHVLPEKTIGIRITINAPRFINCVEDSDGRVIYIKNTGQPVDVVANVLLHLAVVVAQYTNDGKLTVHIRSSFLPLVRLSSFLVEGTYTAHRGFNMQYYYVGTPIKTVDFNPLKFFDLNALCESHPTKAYGDVPTTFHFMPKQ